MTTHKVADLEGPLLNLFVAKAEGWTWWRNKRDGFTVTRPDGSRFEAGNYPAKYDPDSGERLPEISAAEAVHAYGDLFYDTDWSQDGPIIEREGISLIAGPPWSAYYITDMANGEILQSSASGHGETPLIAAMRAYVASKFGETVELP